MFGYGGTVAEQGVKKDAPGSQKGSKWAQTSLKNHKKHRGLVNISEKVPLRVCPKGENYYILWAPARFSLSRPVSKCHQKAPQNRSKIDQNGAPEGIRKER